VIDIACIDINGGNMNWYEKISEMKLGEIEIRASQMGYHELKQVVSEAITDSDRQHETIWFDDQKHTMTFVENMVSPELHVVIHSELADKGLICRIVFKPDAYQRFKKHIWDNFSVQDIQKGQIQFKDDSYTVAYAEYMVPSEFKDLLRNRVGLSQNLTPPEQLQTARMVAQIVELGKNELGLDPDHNDPDMQDLSYNLKSAAELYIAEKQEWNKYPFWGEVKDTLRDINKKHGDIVKHLKYLPPGIVNEINARMDIHTDLEDYVYNLELFTPVIEEVAALEYDKSGGSRGINTAPRYRFIRQIQKILDALPLETVRRKRAAFLRGCFEILGANFDYKNDLQKNINRALNNGMKMDRERKERLKQERLRANPELK
jgi:hypothetical protein